MLVAIGIAFLALLLVWDYLNKQRRYDILKMSKISGPKVLPLFGCGLAALSLGAHNLIPWVTECFVKYGNTYRLWVLNEAQIFTKDLRSFEKILSSTTVLQKGDLYEYVRAFINDGLLVSVGSKWHARRKVFTTAFHFKVLEHYVRVFDEQSEIMAQQLAAHADGKKAVDIQDAVSLAALDVITEAAMGVRVNAQRDPKFPYVKALKYVTNMQTDRMFKLNQRSDWIFRLTAPKQYKRLMDCIKTMHDFTIGVIEERRAALDKAIAEGTYKPLSLGDVDTGAKAQMALLDILLQSSIGGKPLTNEDIREEVDTFVFEGDDTTSSGISYALYSIARNAHLQDKLVKEIHNVLGTDKHAPVTIQQLQELKYLDCVIKETMRMYPPVPAIGRKLNQDIVIDDKVIPANTSIYLVIYSAHRDANYFPQPDTFMPERFLEETTVLNPFAYVPFSAGPKNCIGQKFAVLDMKVMISKVLRYYELLPLGPDVQPMVNLILRSRTGIHIGLRPRT